jgi:transcriptional regulator with XRE-family HTH domain
MNFGTRLKQLRTQCRLNQQQMCSRLNMEQSTYSRYESGITKPVSDFIIRVAKEFNVSTDWLLYQ